MARVFAAEKKIKPPPRTPKLATIWAAEQNLPPWEVPPKPKPPPKSFNRTKPTPVAQAKQTTVDQNQRYRWAVQAPVSPTARAKLAVTMTPQRRKQVLHPEHIDEAAAAAYRRAHPSLLDRVTPLVKGLLISPEQRAETLGHTIGGFGIGLGKSLAEKTASDLLTASRGRASSTAPTSLWQAQAPRSAAGLPPDLLNNLGLGAAKTIAAGGGAVASLRHPKNAIPKIVNEGIDSLRGVGQIGGLLILASDPRLPQATRTKLLSDVGTAAINYYAANYGPNSSFRDAFQHGEDQPFNATLDAATTLAPAAKGLVALKLLRDTNDIGEALRLMHSPDTPRILRAQVKGGAEMPVEAQWSRSPLMRTAVNRPYDLISRVADRAPGLNRLPIAEARRAARAIDRRTRRQMRRLPAEARAMFQDVEAVVKRDPEYATALATLMQKPKGFTNDEWMAAVVADLKEMLSGRSFVSAERDTPGIKRLRNRIKVFEKRAEQARVRRRARASGNIGREQTRLADALDEIGTQRRSVIEQMKSADPEQTKELTSELSALNSQARVAREELDGISVTQEPIDHSNRDLLRTQLEQHPNFQDANAGAVDDVLAVTDARARVWAGQTGRPASDWYETLGGRMTHPDTLPTEGRVVTRPNASRAGDYEGAVRFLTAEGNPTLELAATATPSSVLRSLVGNATNEMHELYPNEFAAVEEHIGRPYADWTADDHERFATWAERYFDEGLAPTPELVGPMERIKTWMRATYAGLRSLLGERLPVATRALFDSYFGAYDDENVARIAMNMGREGWGREDLSRERYGSGEVLARQQLAAIEKSVATRRYNLSLDGQVNRLEELASKGPETWSADEHAEYVQLSADVLTRQAALEIKQSEREQALRGKISDLETALAKGIDGPAFQGALTSMKWISEDRERILREAYGAQYDAMFAQRRDLLADWLVERGLLKPTFERGSAYYFPVTAEPPSTRTLKGPSRSITRPVVGKTRTDLLKLHKRNEMILWQRGDWVADPAVMMDAHRAAQSFSYTNEVKKTLWDLGRPLTFAESRDLPKDVYLINPNGTPLGPELKAQINSSTTTLDHQRVLDGVDAYDEARLQASQENYVRAFMIDPEHLPPGFDPTVVPGLRVVPKYLVNSLLPPVRGSGSRVGEIGDFVTTLARWSLIYANAPRYMLTNGVGNVAFLLLQQGLKLPQTIAASRALLMDSKLAERVAAEAGEVPATAAISRGRTFSAKVKHWENKALEFESLVDKYPRMVAWVYEARKLGYKSNSEMLRLVDGKGAKAARDRERVAEFTNEHMVNFDRMTHWEKQSMTRVLFVWPWIRGATAWPFWYAKNFPERAGILAATGTALNERREQILGPTPPWYRDLTPAFLKGQHALVVNAGPISPTSTAADELNVIQDLVASALGRPPDNTTRTLIELFSPTIRDTTQALTGMDARGKQQSLQAFAEGLGTTFLPGYSIATGLAGTDLFGQQTTPRAFEFNTGLESRAGRQFIRINPQIVSVPWLNEQAQKTNTPPLTERIQSEVEKSRKDWAKVAPGQQYSRVFEDGVKRKLVLSDAEQALIKSKSRSRTFEPVRTSRGTLSTQPALSSYEKAKLAYTVLERYKPSEFQYVPEPDALLKKFKYTPRSAHGKALMDEWMREVWDVVNAPPSTITRSAKQKRQGEALQKEGNG